jgi:hypothetical protein
MSKQRCETLAKKYNATIHQALEVLSLEAPTGKTMDGDVHEYHYHFPEGFKAGAWEEMLHDLKYMNKMGSFPVCQKKADYEICEWCDSVSETTGADA